MLTVSLRSVMLNCCRLKLSYCWLKVVQCLGSPPRSIITDCLHSHRGVCRPQQCLAPLWACAEWGGLDTSAPLLGKRWACWWLSWLKNTLHTVSVLCWAKRHLGGCGVNCHRFIQHLAQLITPVHHEGNIPLTVAFREISSTSARRWHRLPWCSS